jgi:hypothetical protein
MTRPCSFIAAAALTAVAASAVAQPAPPSRQDQLRHQIYLMEGVLARAVTSGAARLNAQFRAVMPDLVVVAGESNARGFNLDGYGVFFDVEVPVLRQSMMWSLRTMLDQDQQGASEALSSLRAVVASTSGRDRAVAEDALRRLELQLRPFGFLRPADGQALQPASLGAAAAAPAAAPAAPAANGSRAAVNALLTQDPNKAYTDAVLQALTEAIVDNALPMVSVLDPEAYLTVAARDNERRDLLAPPTDQVSTFTLRIKAADLAAYRTGKIDREEAKKRVQVVEF